MAKYAPKHLEVSGGAEPRPTFSGHKATRLAVTAATTIAMTGSTLLAPFSAFANDACRRLLSTPARRQAPQ